MYTITRPAYQIGRADGSGSDMVPEETRTFQTAAGLLRWALDERAFRHGVGGVPYPTRFDQPYMGHKGNRWGLIDGFCRWQFTPEHREAMARAQQRYNEIIHYLREVEPEWRPDTSYSADGIVHYADNSTERHEINKYGKRRHIMIDPPSGDACF